VQTTNVQITGRDGGRVPVRVWRPVASPSGPEGPDRYPAVVLGVEAYGVNAFAGEVAGRLVELGFVVLAADYYRGAGPEDPENYTNFDEVRRCIDELDFVRGTHDQLSVIEYARRLGDVDPDRVVVWGYCTGATLSLLAASVSDQLAAAVLFFPSQPRFQSITARTPVHPVDLLWGLRCPVLIIYGDQDGVMPADQLVDLRARLSTWGVQHIISVQPGAGHAFTAPVPPMRNEEADQASWPQAVDFVQQHLRCKPAN
jgi:carboxymethylenebutenolidase